MLNKYDFEHLDKEMNEPNKFPKVTFMQNICPPIMMKVKKRIIHPEI